MRRKRKRPNKEEEEHQWGEKRPLGRGGGQKHWEDMKNNEQSERKKLRQGNKIVHGPADRGSPPLRLVFFLSATPTPIHFAQLSRSVFSNYPVLQLFRSIISHISLSCSVPCDSPRLGACVPCDGTRPALRLCRRSWPKSERILRRP